MNAKLDHIVTLTPSVSSSTAAGEIDALIDEARTRIRFRTDSKLYFILSSHPTLQVHRRSFSRMARKKHTRRRCRPTRTHRHSYHLGPHITDPEVARMVNQVTNRILGLGEEVEPGSVQ